MSKRPNRVALIYLSVVFIAGSLLGAAAHSFYAVTTAEGETSPVARYRERFGAKLKQDLNLTAEQVEKVDTILEDIGNRYQEIQREIEADIRNEMQPHIETLRAERIERTMAILDTEQKIKYELLLEERRRRREEKRKAEGCH